MRMPSKRLSGYKSKKKINKNSKLNKRSKKKLHTKLNRKNKSKNKIGGKPSENNNLKQRFPNMTYIDNLEAFLEKLFTKNLSEFRREEYNYLERNYTPISNSTNKSSNLKSKYFDISNYKFKEDLKFFRLNEEDKKILNFLFLKLERIELYFEEIYETFKEKKELKKNLKNYGKENYLDRFKLERKAELAIYFSYDSFSSNSIYNQKLEYNPGTKTSSVEETNSTTLEAIKIYDNATEALQNNFNSISYKIMYNGENNELYIEEINRVEKKYYIFNINDNKLQIIEYKHTPKNPGFKGNKCVGYDFNKIYFQDKNNLILIDKNFKCMLTLSFDLTKKNKNNNKFNLLKLQQIKKKPYILEPYIEFNDDEQIMICNKGQILILKTKYQDIIYFFIRNFNNALDSVFNF